MDIHTGSMDSYYNEIAKGYNELYGEEQEEKAKIIIQNLEIKPGDKLLDVGCGTGKATKLFKCKKFGIDPSTELLSQASKTGLIVTRGVAEALPFPDKSFDIVISITAIHNFSNPELGLKEMARVGRRDFAFSVLKKAKNYALIEKAIKKLFKIVKKIEHPKDTIFICQKV